MPLALRGFNPLPPHTAGGFDHGDVHASSGRVFVAHTANASIDVIDGSIDMVDCQQMAVVERLTTADGAHTTAFDASRQVLYVFSPRSCRAAVYQEQAARYERTEESCASHGY